jgi:isoleucyl-tRNA synthetase
VRQLLLEQQFEWLDGGRIKVAEFVLEPDEIIEQHQSLDGHFVQAGDGTISVALDTSLDDELRLEARLNDLIRDVQVRRKEIGLAITDRIRLAIPDEELLVFAHRIAEETLAVTVERGSELALEKAEAS